MKNKLLMRPAGNRYLTRYKEESLGQSYNPMSVYYCTYTLESLSNIGIHSKMLPTKAMATQGMKIITLPGYF